MAYGQLDKVMRFLRQTVVPDPSAVTDRQLLERFAQKRDEQAFTVLVERHGPMVLAVCRRVLGDSHAAEDAFQATFLVLAQKAPTVRWQESVGGWLHEVAFRVAQKTRVEAARRRAHERQVPDVSTANPIADVSWRELRAVLDEELTRLPEKYRVPLVLCYLEGKTNEEAAQQLGWTKGTVSGQLARARDLLRARLGRRGVALPAACGVALAECAASAAVSPTLLTSTIKAAVLGTAAKAAAAGAVSAPVAALAEGVIQTMFVTKMKMAALILVAVGLVAGGAGLLGYRTLAGGNPTAAVALAPLPEEARPMNAAPKASEPVEKNGLQITARPDKAVFELGQPLAFTVTFKNVSKDDFTLLHSPLVVSHCKFHIAGEKEGILWDVIPLPKAAAPAPVSPPPCVLKAGQSVEATLRLDENFVFDWKGEQLAKPMPVKQLPAGKYRLALDVIFLGVTKDVQLSGKPPLWVGQLATKPTPFEISDKAAALSDTAKERAKALKDTIDNFQLQLSFFGPEEKPYYRLTLSCFAVVQDGKNPFYQKVRIDKAQAEKLIDHLAAKGFLDRADNIFGKRLEPFGGPTYVCEMRGPEKVILMEDLGWGGKLLKSLDEIRQSLDGDAAKKMDTLIGRLGGIRSTDEMGGSQPVRVNGVDFEALADTRWTTPAPGKTAAVAVAFRITNRSDKELTFNLFDTLGLRIKAADGKELARKAARDATRPVPPIQIAAGKSETITWRPELSWLPDGKTLRLSGGDGSGTVWSFDGLVAGKYSLSFGYQNKVEQVRILKNAQPFWIGTLQTDAVEVEIVGANP